MQPHRKYVLLASVVVCSLFMASANAASYFTQSWSSPASGVQTGALDSFENVVCFGTDITIGPNNYLYAVNASSGFEFWQYNTSLPVNYVTHFNRSGIAFTVAGTGGAGSQPGKSYVIARSLPPSNVTLWQSTNLNSSVKSVGAVESNITGTNDIVAGLDNGTIMRLSGYNNGSILWKRNCNGTVFTVSNLKNGSFIVGSRDINSNGHVYCFEMNGTLRWFFPPSSSPLASRPLLKIFTDITGDGIPEVIAVFHDGKIHVLNGASGQEVSPWPFNNPGNFSIKDLLCTQDYTGDGFPDIITATDNGTLMIINGENASRFRGPTPIGIFGTSLSYIQYMYFYDSGKTYLNKTLAVSASEPGPPLTYSIWGINTTTLSIMKQYSPSALATNMFNISNSTSLYTGDLIFSASNYVYSISGSEIIVPELVSNYVIVALIIMIWVLAIVGRRYLRNGQKSSNHFQKSL